LSLITLTQLQKHWPHGDATVPGLMEGIADSADSVFAKYAITSQLVAAMMFGQFSEETGGGVDMVEDIRYSPARACQLWPSRFVSVADVYAKIGSYVGDPQFATKLMDSVYGNRMGNGPQSTHDGSNYIGRGLSQCTGKDGYAKVAEKTGIDVVGHPELFSSPLDALECGVADFILCGCLPFAEKGDTLNTTKRLNGGTIGLQDRINWTNAWRQEMGV
jgi:putative chitinase